MNKKEQSELKSTFGKNEGLIQRVATCYVDVLNGNNMIMQDVRMLQNFPDEEHGEFLSFIKKSISGKPGVTGIELPVKARALSEINELRDSELKDQSLIKDMFEKIRDNFISEGNYCIMITYGAYDVPQKKDDLRSDDYDEVYRFLIISIHPCNLKNLGIIFNDDTDVFEQSGSMRNLLAPSHAFLYPSFSERHTDVDHVFYTMKNQKDVDAVSGVLEALFNTGIPTEKNKQLSAFNELMRAGFDDQVPYEAMQKAYDHLSDLCEQARAQGEERTFTAKEISDMIIDDFGADEQMRGVLEETASDYEDYTFTGAVIAPKTVDLITPQAIVKMNIADIAGIEKRKIDGREYFIIPAQGSSISGVTLK